MILLDSFNCIFPSCDTCILGGNSSLKSKRCWYTCLKDTCRFPNLLERAAKHTSVETLQQTNLQQKWKPVRSEPHPKRNITFGRVVLSAKMKKTVVLYDRNNKLRCYPQQLDSNLLCYLDRNLLSQNLLHRNLPGPHLGICST